MSLDIKDNDIANPYETDQQSQRSFGATYLRSWASAREGKGCLGSESVRVTTVESGHPGASTLFHALVSRSGSAAISSQWSRSTAATHW
jgi:hypothetical protein